VTQTAFWDIYLTEGIPAFTGTPAFPYSANISDWTNPEYADSSEGDSYVDIDLDMPRLLAQIPAFSSQYPGIGSCTWYHGVVGAPTVLIRVTTVTAPVLTTSTIAGNWVAPTSPAAGPGSAESDPGSPATGLSSSPSIIPASFASASSPTPTAAEEIPTQVASDAGTAGSSVLILMPSALSQTAAVLIPTEVTSRVVPGNTPTDVSSTAVPAEGDSLASATESENDNQGQPSSTPNMGSMIAGGIGLTQVQPSPTPSAVSENGDSSASANQDTRGSQATGNGPFTSANTPNVKTTPAGSGATGASTSLFVAGGTTAAAAQVGGSQQPQGTIAVLGGSTVLVLSAASSAGLGDDSKPTLTVASVYHSTLVTATIQGTITTYATQSAVSELLQVISLPSSGVDLQRPQSWLTTATYEGTATTEWVYPVSQAAPQVQSTAVLVTPVQIAPIQQQESTISFNPEAASTLPGQVSAIEQPKATLAVVGGTTFSFLASPPPSAGSGGEQTQGPQKAVPITALVGGSIVTSWAVPVPSASPAVDSSLGGQPYAPPQAQLFTTTISGSVVTAWSNPASSVKPDSETLSIEGQPQATPQPGAALISAIESLAHSSQTRPSNADGNAPITTLRDNPTGQPSVVSSTESSSGSSASTGSSETSVSTSRSGSGIASSSASTRRGTSIQASPAAQSSQNSKSGGIGRYIEVPWRAALVMCCVFAWVL